MYSWKFSLDYIQLLFSAPVLLTVYRVVLRAIVGPCLHHPPRRLLESFLLPLEVYLYFLAAKRVLVGCAVSLPPAPDFENPHQILNVVMASIAAHEEEESIHGIVPGKWGMGVDLQDKKQ